MLGEARVDQPPGRLLGDLAIDAVAHRGMFLEIGERDANGLLMRLDDPLITGDQRHDRHRLGGVDSEIPTRMVLDFSVGPAPAQLLVLDLSG